MKRLLSWYLTQNKQAHVNSEDVLFNDIQMEHVIKQVSQTVSLPTTKKKKEKGRDYNTIDTFVLEAVHTDGSLWTESTRGKMSP